MPRKILAESAQPISIMDSDGNPITAGNPLSVSTSGGESGATEAKQDTIIATLAAIQAAAQSDGGQRPTIMVTP